MLTPRIRTALIALAATAGLSACANMGPYGGVNVGYGNAGYGNYGYGGYNGYGYGPYGYTPAYYGAHNNYYGWYNGFYYPGTGYYVYDPFGNRFRWDPYRDYWEARRPKTDSLKDVVANWSQFRRKGEGTATTSAVTTQTVGATATADQASIRQISEARRQAREQARIERQSVMRETARSERSSTGRAEGSERPRAWRRQPKD